MTGTNIWDAVLARIETKVNRHSFYTWFKPTGFIADHPNGIRVRVPNKLFRDWLTKHYSAVLDEALREVDRSGAALEFITDEALAALGAAALQDVTAVLRGHAHQEAVGAATAPAIRLKRAFALHDARNPCKL